VEILAFELGWLFVKALHILYVALGLGLVIFFHELGHFAVAKWCGVFVERFSIGFGPILWSFKRGDTEYALSAIPFGGYVKMLGQDDMDPSQLSSDEIAQDPHSYSAKNVPQRMGIISAGVIMNIITGMLFFAGAFRLGVESSPPLVGEVLVGRPAWQSGFQTGDRLIRINDREIETFSDILRGTTLSRGEMAIRGVHRDGKLFDVVITPDLIERRMIGITDARSLKVLETGDKVKRTSIPGTPAGRVEFKEGDVIVSVGGEKIESYAELVAIQSRRRAEDLEFVVKRDGQEVSLNVGKRPFQRLGLWMEIEQIAAIQKGSPAAQAGLRVGDKITAVGVKGEDADLQDVGTEINALFLADFFEQHAGQEVDVKVKRTVEGAPRPEEPTITVTPTDTPAWRSSVRTDDTPLEIPSIGVAFHLTPKVLKVDPGSPAWNAGLRGGEILASMKIESQDEDFQQMMKKSSIEIALDQPSKKNMAFAFWQLQEIARPTVTLSFDDKDNKTLTKELGQSTADPDRYIPNRGVILYPESMMLQDDSMVGALGMAFRHTRNTAIDIYLTIRNLFSGDLSTKNLHGPVGIAQVAFEVSKQGMPKLLLFLGFLSVNLAVLNFLPIPVLDGGHMVFLIWEGVTRRRPSERVLIAATYCGMAFVLGLMVFVIYLDIFVHRLSVN
jgi:regulator of sigma E protease